MCLTDVCIEFILKIHIFQWYTGMFDLQWLAKRRHPRTKEGQVTCDTE